MGDWTRPYAWNVLGLTDETAREHLDDDRVGRALTRLFFVDRATLLNDVVLAMIKAFDIDGSQLHNDSSTITLHGGYPEAIGRPRGGKPTAQITYGHNTNKDHRADLKQLLWILTVSADGAVPIAYRLADGNTGDDTTHIPTWDGVFRRWVVTHTPPWEEVRLYFVNRNSPKSAFKFPPLLGNYRIVGNIIRTGNSASELIH